MIIKKEGDLVIFDYQKKHIESSFQAYQVLQLVSQEDPEVLDLDDDQKLRCLVMRAVAGTDKRE